MEPSKINNTHSKDENINEEDKVANKVNTVTLNDFSDGDSGVYEDIILNQTHDICEGIRPKIAEGTVLEYVEFMKRCWDNDPKKRPTASECKFKFAIWLFKYPPENDDEKRVPIPENEPKITYHPNSCYASRKITYSAKLNEHLAQDLLSYKIIIDDDEINENFGTVYEIML
ncbi:unnamed protein product [Rhizophagus irregularis]|nr:unnamed protein product [Rhizophagus irregularis]CAB5200535.1 unnamed protein product [Rhizophagus irregularis]